MKKLNKRIGLLCLLIVAPFLVFAQSYKLPEFEKLKLKNGLTIYLMEQHDVPIISVSVILPAGAIYDNEKAGLASLTSTALKLGTKNFSKKIIDEELDFLGASLNTYASKEYAGLSSKFATKDIATQSITVYPEYSYPASGTPTLSGYRATQSFDITIRSATTAGAVVDAIVEAGGDNLQVNGVSPFVLDSDKATETARTAAVKKAKAKAASYAKLLA